MSVRAGGEGGADERMPSCAIGVVVANEDPEGLGRVRVTYPHMDGGVQSLWVPIAAPMAGPGHGFQSVPEVDTEVLLGFDRGRANHPYVIGCLWNGADRPPHPDPRVRTLHSLNDNRVIFIDSTPDSGDNGALVIADGNGNTISMSNGLVSICSAGTLLLKGKNVAVEVSGVVRNVGPGAKRI